MMRIWGTLFVPATLLVMGALTTLVVSLLEWESTLRAWLLGAAVLVALLVWQRRFRPVLGSDD